MVVVTSRKFFWSSLEAKRHSVHGPNPGSLCSDHFHSCRDTWREQSFTRLSQLWPPLLVCIFSISNESFLSDFACGRESNFSVLMVRHRESHGPIINNLFRNDINQSRGGGEGEAEEEHSDCARIG